MSVAAAEIRNEINEQTKRLALARITHTKATNKGGTLIYTKGDFVFAGRFVLNLLTLGFAGAATDSIKEDAKKGREHIDYKASATLDELSRSISAALHRR